MFNLCNLVGNITQDLTTSSNETCKLCIKATLTHANTTAADLNEWFSANCLPANTSQITIQNTVPIIILGVSVAALALAFCAVGCWGLVQKRKAERGVATGVIYSISQNQNGRSSNRASPRNSPRVGPSENAQVNFSS